MPDVLTATQRSYNMSQIRSKGTAPEKNLEAILRAEKLNRFVTHPAHIIGKPDIYFSRGKLAIFMDGCFWHACSRCFQLPSTNRKFWENKIQTNLARDKKVNEKLISQGIRVLRIREHELNEDPEKIIYRI